MNTNTPTPVLSRDTVRMLDRLTIERCGIPGIVLMENAGAGSARLLSERLQSAAWHEPVVVLAGPGNNGGDGFVIARHLHNGGASVTVFLLGRASRLRPGSDALTNLEALRGTGVPLQEVDHDSDLLLEGISGAGCFVDALFGTGLDRALDDRFGQLFACVEHTGRPVLAVDVPSGLDAETGAVRGAALRADVTATFGAAKPGLLRGAGPALCGQIVVVPISIPEGLIRRAAEDEQRFRAWAAQELGSGTNRYTV